MGAVADVVLFNAVLHTMDAANPAATALAIDDGALVYVGTDDGARAFIGDSTQVVDLAGATVLPGLIDAHTHLVTSGAEAEDAALGDCKTVDDLLAVVRSFGAAHPTGWLLGGGYDVSAFEGHLTRQQLDGVVSDRPVFMGAVDGHTAWVNSEALRVAGITAKSKDVPGGVIDRDADGVPTGMVRENALELLYAVMPEYPADQLDRGLDAAQAEAHSFGITSAIEPGGEEFVMETYGRAERAGTLDLRVRAAMIVDGPRGVASAIKARKTYDSNRLAVDAVKLFLDGVIESETALMLEPYADGRNGEALFTDDALRRTAQKADRAGLQLHAHALGDGAVHQMLDALAWLETTEGPRDRRPLLAHLEVIDPADVPRFAALGAYADFQPLWAYPDSYIRDLTWPVIGPERSRWLYPIGSVDRAGGVIVGGSDWSVSSMNPFEAIEVAVTRQDPDEPGDVLVAEERVTVDRMLRAYTIDAARAMFLESEVGSITVGKRADLIVVDADPYTVKPHALSDVHVTQTWFDGRVVFAR